MSEILEYRVRPVTRFIVTEYDSLSKTSTVIAEVDGGGTADRIAEIFAQKASPQPDVAVIVHNVGTADQPAAPETSSGRFRKKPIVIEACRWEGCKCGLTNGVGPMGIYPIPERLRLTSMFMPTCRRVSEIDREFDGRQIPEGEVWRAGDFLYIGTLEGTHRADPGDWIIRGVKGELYPCKPDIFAATYEAA